MKREDVEALISTVVEDIIAGSELELVDVEYVRERDWYLRIFLDKAGGIDLDDCQWVSEHISEYLDKKDPITDNYLLEVSSPGLDRVLKKEKDFIRYKGATVDLQLFAKRNGSKQITGILKGHTDTSFNIDVDGEVIDILRDTVAQMRLHIDF